MDGAFFQILFLSLTEIILLFSLLFADMDNNTDGFLMLNQPCISGINSTWLTSIILIFCGTFLKIIILLRSFSAMLMRATFSDFCYINVWFWYQ